MTRRNATILTAPGLGLLLGAFMTLAMNQPVSLLLTLFLAAGTIITLIGGAFMCFGE